MDDLPRTLPRTTADGLFQISLRPCTAGVLRHLFDPDIPYAWVVGHSPHRSIQWWGCDLPLTRSGAASRLEVRGLRFDLLLPTREFLARVDEFDGLTALQMRRRVPDTLAMEHLDDRNRTRILVQNGLAAWFYLPHRMEVASFQAVERPAIERALANEAVRALAC